MVKGISRQVIVVQSPDPKLFEQAIFILKDGQKEVTDEALLKEANRLISNHRSSRRRGFSPARLIWAASGALVTGLLWLITAVS